MPAAKKKKRNKSTSDTIKKIRDSRGFKEVLPLFRFGFELETQQTEGKSLRDWQQEAPKVKRMSWDYRVNRNTLQDMPDDPCKFLEKSWEGFDNKLLEVAQDGSVDGFEIRTKGGLDIESVKKAIELVFTKKHTIDTGCSFHVHLSVEGIKPKYNPEFQWRMMEFLLGHMDDVPKSVKKRWKDKDTREEYFALIPDEDKCTFVSYHYSGNTWEFRCFGNISNAKDANKCILLAAQAYRYAVKVFYEKKKAISGITASDIEVGDRYDSYYGEDSKERKIIEAVFSKGKSLQVILAESKKDKKKGRTKKFIVSAA